MAKKKTNLDKKTSLDKEIFYINFVFMAITIEPEMLESQSRAQKTQIIA